MTVIVAACTCALLLVSCRATSQPIMAAVSGGHSAATPSSQASFNEADVMFAQKMIPHHQQAVQMSQMAATHAQDPRVKRLAASIAATQTAEIKIMTAMLSAWGQPIPTSMPGMMSPMPGMMGSPHPGMSSPSTPAMMSQHEMSQMMAAHGAQFDRMFLQMMIKHHQGAVEMAKTELAHGINPAAKRLAHRIEVSQAAQISQMQLLLKELSPSPVPSSS